MAILSVLLYLPLVLFGVVMCGCMTIYLWHKKNVGEFKQRIAQQKRRSTDNAEESVEVIIIGAGVVGSALGATLARDGRKVTIIERSLKPFKTFAGEILMPGGVQALRDLGLEDCIKDVDGAALTGLAVEDPVNGQVIHLPYNNPGASFHHDKFVKTLRDAASKEPLCTIVEGNVIRLLEEDDVIKGVEYRNKSVCNNESDEWKVMRSKMVIVCDGVYSRFRQANVVEVPKQRGFFVGFEFEGKLARPGRLEMLLRDDGFAYIYQIAPNTTRVIVDIRGSMPKKPREVIKTIVNQFPTRLQPEMDQLRENVETMRSIPTNQMAPGGRFQPGVVTLGDAFNIRHPMTGAGMSVGLKDVLFWAKTLKQVNDLSDYETIKCAMKVFLIERKFHSSTVTNVFSNTMHSVFTPTTDACRNLRDGVVAYLNLGGACATGPTEIFAINQTNPTVLIFHLLACTVYSMYLCVRMAPPRKLLCSITKAFSVLGCACSILLPLLWDEMRTIFLQTGKCMSPKIHHN